LPSANSEAATDTAPIFQVLDKMDDTYFKSHEQQIACPSGRRSLCQYLATVAIYEKKIGAIKPILETDHEQYEMSFHAEYDNLKQLLKFNRELLRVIDESSFKCIVPPGNTFNRLPIWYFVS
jgi:hypothetical protein